MTPTTLRAVMARLRDPEGGCPWDLKQDHQSLAKYLREEAAEVLDALAAHKPGDDASEAHLKEELGDLWLQVVFHAQLAVERGAFDLDGIEGAVVEKLIRRHPHVFGETEVEDAEGVLTNWELIKAQERAAKGEATERRLLAGVPASLSPVEEAMEIGRRCAKVGFEWPDLDGVMDKVAEELDELRAEFEPTRVEEEFGDLFFSLVQWARYKGLDPDRALRRQMTRFKGRFEKVEDDARAAGGWEHRTLDQMEAAWQMAKKQGA